MIRTARHQAALPARRLLMASAKLPHRHIYFEDRDTRYDVTPLPWWFNQAWRFVDWLSS